MPKNSGHPVDGNYKSNDRPGGPQTRGPRKLYVDTPVYGQVDTDKETGGMIVGEVGHVTEKRLPDRKKK